MIKRYFVKLIFWRMEMGLLQNIMGKAGDKACSTQLLRYTNQTVRFSQL